MRPLSARSWLLGLAGAATCAGACSVGSLDGYAAGGTTTGPGATSSSRSSTSTSVASSSTGSATGGSVASPSASSSGSTSSAGGGRGVGGSMGVGGGVSSSSGTLASSVSSSSSSSSGATCNPGCATGYACMDGVCGNAVVDVSTFFATCAVLKAGEVWCWGRNVWGELGFAPTASNATCLQSDKCQTTPIRVTAGLPDPTVEPAIAVSAGREATCALTSAGNVYCWGSNIAGLLGHAPNTDATCTKAGSGTPSTGPCSPTPQKVGLPAGVKAVQISMGTVAACARTSENDVYCWGSNASGELQAPISSGILGVAVPNANVSQNAMQVSVGSDEAAASDAVCAVLSGSQEVACWGGSANGELFPTPMNGSCLGGDAKCTPTAVIVPTVFKPNSGMPVTADSIGIGLMTGVLLKGGAVSAWGLNNYGGIGVSAAASYPPTPLSIGASISMISNPSLTTVMLDTAGNVWALGWNDEGAVGNGVFGPNDCPLANGQKCQNTPVKLMGISGMVKAVAGSNDGAAIGADGRLWMWGSNYMASLGHAPGTAGDVGCGGGSLSTPCNPTPGVVTALP